MQGVILLNTKGIKNDQPNGLKFCHLDKYL